MELSIKSKLLKLLYSCPPTSKFHCLNNIELLVICLLMNYDIIMLLVNVCRVCVPLRVENQNRFRPPFLLKEKVMFLRQMYHGEFEIGKIKVYRMHLPCE